MPEEHSRGPSPMGTVVLDIGGSTGALLVHVTCERAGTEIDIRRLGEPWSGAHTGVRERHGAQHVFFAGLFPALEEGTYEIRWRGGISGSRRIVDVTPGSVTETALSE